MTDLNTKIDTRVQPHIRIINGSLDEDPTSPGGIVLIGRIDASTLRFLKVDDGYQRSLSNRVDIWEALRAGKIPPAIDIGVRGQDFVSDGADYIIRSPAFMIDGQQRIGTAQNMLEQFPEMQLRLFAMCHFNTNEEWESERFDDLNKNIVKVSGSQHLRNSRGKNVAVLTLYGLCENAPDFALYKRVCWGQNMQRGDLMTAINLAKVAMQLHSHLGVLSTGKSDAVAAAILRGAIKVGLHSFRQNIHTFFSVLNECWPVKGIEYRNSATQIKSGFLGELARVLSRHRDFWDQSGKLLFISADDRRKLAKFPINDPQVASLAGSAGKARSLLYQLMVNHLNSGRRTNRLVER